jgi:hypothetical protein
VHPLPVAVPRQLLLRHGGVGQHEVLLLGVGIHHLQVLLPLVVGPGRDQRREERHDLGVGARPPLRYRKRDLLADLVDPLHVRVGHHVHAQVLHQDGLRAEVEHHRLSKSAEDRGLELHHDGVLRDGLVVGGGARRYKFLVVLDVALLVARFYFGQVEVVAVGVLQEGDRSQGFPRPHRELPLVVAVLGRHRRRQGARAAVFDAVHALRHHGVDVRRLDPLLQQVLRVGLP